MKISVPRRGAIALLVMLFMSSWVKAQEVGEIAVVVQGVQSKSIAGATVELRHGTNGSRFSMQTDENGKVVFSKLAVDSNYCITVSFVGFRPTEQCDIIVVPEKRSSTLVLLTEVGVQDMDEVVVVGYNKQSRSRVTTSVATLDTKVIENVPFTNAASALQGTVPGVQVQSISGQPGAAPRVIIRGGTSINNPNGSEPLYIVDGIIRENLNDINPADIESMSILKDAASTAIYGARGSNGVVIVTTITGKSGQTRVNYAYSLTTSRPSMTYDMANAREYIEFNRLGIQRAGLYTPAKLSRFTLPNGYGTGNDLTNNTAYTVQYLNDGNKHKLDEGWESMPDPIDPSKTIIFKHTDFQDLIYRTALTNNHHVNLTGGTETVKFNAGVGYMDSEGTAITTQYDRLSLNLGGELRVRDNIRFFGKTMYTGSSNNEVYNLANIFYRSAGTPPSAKYTFEDGTLAPGQSRSIGNPVYHLQNDVNKNAQEQLSLSVGADWEILPHLSLKPQFSMFKISNDRLSFIPSYWNGPTSFNNSRISTNSFSKRVQKQADVLLNYVNTIGVDHNFDAMLGFSYFGRQNSGFNAVGQGAATDLIPTLNASATPVSVGGSISDQVLIGYFGSVNYDYKGRYLLTANARYDGASNLGVNYRWGFFPGVSAGWNMHREEFWQRAGLSDVLQTKLRASYGLNGNISGLSDYQAQGEYDASSRYAGISAIQNTVLANSELRWEQSKTLNVGADIGLLNNRFSIVFDAYRRVTDNLVTSLVLPPSTGFSSIFTNLGTLENKGIELDLAANIFPAHKAFQWRSGIMAAKTRHKILKLPDNGNENNRVGGVYVWDSQRGDYNWLGGLQEGERINDQYGYRQIRIFPTDQEAANGPVNTLIPGNNKTSYAGYVEWYDADGDGKIDASDRVYTGNYYPVWNGGLSNTFSYRSVELYVRVDFTAGHTIYNYARRFMNNNSQGDGNFLKEMVTDSWQHAGDNASLPLYVHQQAYNFPVGHDIYYEKGDFLNLREITLSYTLPQHLVRRAKLSNVRFHMTGSNLHYFTKYKGLNPEEGGEDNGRYPMPRNVSFGLSLSL